MPEGPEIKLAADSIAKALANRRVTEVFFKFGHLKKYESQFKDKKIRDVITRGKAILTLFDDEHVIYSHNQLYGRWYVVKKGNIPNTRRDLRMAIHNREFSAYLFSASEIEVLSLDDLPSHRFLSKLGPDLLSEDPSYAEILTRLESDRFNKRQLGALLLDQCFVAGLGNYLRAEILLAAGLHPLRRSVDCNRNELIKLSKEILRLTHRSYRTKGIVNPPSLVKKLKAQGRKQKEQYRFSVYDREGEQCYSCRTTIERIDSGGRHIYFCPGCQATRA